jgi:hypothetical protein
MTMNCKICKLDLPLDKFRKQPKNKSGYRHSCKRCDSIRRCEKNRENRINKGLTIRFPTLANRMLMEEGKKYCPTCKQILNINEFSTTKKGTGIGSHCKECCKIWREKLKKDHPDWQQKRQKKYNSQKLAWIRSGLKRNFGLSYEEYLKILNFQKNKCAICGKTQKENKRMLSVDHDHKTLKLRGIVCANCNHGLGNFKDDITVLTNAIKYLSSPPYDEYLNA